MTAVHQKDCMELSEERLCITFLYHAPKQFEKKEFTWANIPEEIKVYVGKDGMDQGHEANAAARKLRDIYIQEAVKLNRKWGHPTNLRILLPVSYFPQQDSTS